MGASQSSGPPFELDPRVLSSPLLDRATRRVSRAALALAIDGAIPEPHRRALAPSFGVRVVTVAAAAAAAGTAEEARTSLSLSEFAEFVARALGHGYAPAAAGPQQQQAAAASAAAQPPPTLTAARVYAGAFSADGLAGGKGGGASARLGARDVAALLLAARLLGGGPLKNELPLKFMPAGLRAALDEGGDGDGGIDGGEDLADAVGDFVARCLPGFWDLFVATVEAAVLPAVSGDGDGDGGGGGGGGGGGVTIPPKLAVFGRGVTIASRPMWRSAFRVPELVSGDETNIPSVAGSVLAASPGRWLLPLALPGTTAASGRWTLLYSSQSHGLSNNRLQKQVFMYGGPTMVVIADTAGQVFGCVVDVEWQESAKAFGGPGCRAFSLTPDFEVYKGDASFYYNTRGRAGEHGLGVYLRGKKRIWIDSDLKKGERSMGPGVKAVGVPEPVEVARLEVWGCGDPGCLEKQMATRKTRANIAERAGKAKPLDWETDRDMLVMAGGKGAQNLVAGEAGRLEHEEERKAKLEEENG